MGVLEDAGETGALSVGRCRVGRSSELLDGDEPGAGVLDGAGVLEAGELEVGVLEEDPLPAERCRVGRSSVVTAAGGASDFFAAAVTICHLPRAVQPLLLEPLKMVAVPTGIPVVCASYTMPLSRAMGLGVAL